jgi:Ca2+-transporting ATPase
VAREAAALVLLDDDFSAIVEAVRGGRRIQDNLRCAMAYLLAVHVPLAGMALVPLLLGWPLVLLPVHIVLLELVIDPACSIVLEAEPAAPDLMCRPPRPVFLRLFTRALVARALLMGGSTLAVVLALLVGARTQGVDAPVARSLVLTTLVVANLALVLANRARGFALGDVWRGESPALGWVFGGAIGLLATVLGMPVLREAFHLGPLAPVSAVVCGVAGVLSVAWLRGLGARPLARGSRGD